MLMNKEQSIIHHQTDRFTTNKTIKMYYQLLDCFEKFSTDETIQESMHRYDTQINKLLNEPIS